ncbi:hypothetical protein CYMTET_37199, partial [Cymbomonas tetramitiformis]
MVVGLSCSKRGAPAELRCPERQKLKRVSQCTSYFWICSALAVLQLTFAALGPSLLPTTACAEDMLHRVWPCTDPKRGSASPAKPSVRFTYIDVNVSKSGQYGSLLHMLQKEDGDTVSPGLAWLQNLAISLSTSLSPLGFSLLNFGTDLRRDSCFAVNLSVCITLSSRLRENRQPCDCLETLRCAIGTRVTGYLLLQWRVDASLWRDHRRRWEPAVFPFSPLSILSVCTGLDFGVSGTDGGGASENAHAAGKPGDREQLREKAVLIDAPDSSWSHTPVAEAFVGDKVPARFSELRGATWQECAFCDIRLEAHPAHPDGATAAARGMAEVAKGSRQREGIPAHRLVLAAASSMLAERLTHAPGRGRGNSTGGPGSVEMDGQATEGAGRALVMRLHGASWDALEAVVDYVYRGSATVPRWRLLELAVLADMLGLSLLKDAAEDLLIQGVDAKRAAQALVAAEDLGLEALAAQAFTMTCNNFDAIWRTDDLYLIDAQQLQRILLSDGLRVPEEEAVLAIALRWFEGGAAPASPSEASREQSRLTLLQLLQAVRWPLLDGDLRDMLVAGGTAAYKASGREDQDGRDLEDCELPEVLAHHRGLMSQPWLREGVRCLLQMARKAEVEERREAEDTPLARDTGTADEGSLDRYMSESASVCGTEKRQAS